ncbi:response regulator transcription factor [Qipengyuania aquimaris]|uniref:response regulator transcription factor n=1 Tax=Qipengyuania aquimaris TaxID=255984 RepID=UPI001FD3B161|nr:LuxR C-terminal-related transcriptional regulator [Qipengyuania aquimaris]UOR14324.1 LuxR C-terminal-related transcriptional regulator [Qipengyuania aquimaris]
MEQRDKLHIVDGSSRSRAEQARRGFDLGYHCEVYGDVSELVNSAPETGIVLARDGDGCGSSALVVESLNRNGIWLPVVATAVEPSPSQVVAAIKSGALDFLRLPLQPERLVNMVECIRAEAVAYGESMRRMAQARVCLAKLTPREREVLELVVAGESNKQIARDLGISHRTVELHRSSIMSKLGADRAAEVIRLRLEARLGPAPILKAS